MKNIPDSEVDVVIDRCPAIEKLKSIPDDVVKIWKKSGIIIVNLYEYLATTVDEGYALIKW